MRPIRVSAVTLNQTPYDWAGNRERLLRGAVLARDAGAQLVVFPEMALNGYGCEDGYYSPGLVRRTERHLVEVARACPDLVLAVSVPVRHGGELYNALAITANGKVAGIIAKQFLAKDGVHYEPRWFTAWHAGRHDTVEYGGNEVLIGDIVFDIGGVRIGGEICEDAWVADRPAHRLAARGVDVVVGPSASHFALGKDRIREALIVEGSRIAGAAYVFTNSLGNESGRCIFDGQRLVAANGEILARGDLLRFHDVGMTTATVDLDALPRRQAVAPKGSFGVVEVDWQWANLDDNPASDGDGYSPWLKGKHRREEELARAVALGLHDYQRKSRSSGFVVSLSGGADSAACAALAALSVTMARRELGDAEAARRLGRTGFEDDSLAGGLLDTVYQASENSGDTTRSAARAVAEGIGARHAEWSIQPMADHCLSVVEEMLGRGLDWATDDIVLQNIQARVRAPGIWMLANIRNALLLATGNRSEASVGYSTMDGDTAGSISPIAGIDKHYLREWLRWLAATGPDGIGPIPGVQAVCDLEPTAELRPAERHQTDEADLMPYELLDAIERLAVRNRMEPGEILAELAPVWVDRMGGEQALKSAIVRFFRMHTRNQWKRERYAPSFQLDAHSLDPKSWYRFPILSGGFGEELEEM